MPSLVDYAKNVPVIGGVIGSGGSLQKRLAGQAPSMETPQYDPTRPDVERNLGNQVREGQSEYNAWLKNAAMGNGPSVAQQQLSQGRDSAIGAAASQAAAARGGNAALAGRTATQSAANTTMQAARDSAALRAQEQMGYANQWGQGLQAQRAGDLTARGQSVDEQKAQLAAQTAYQQNEAQIASGNAERGQGIFGSVLGGGPGDVFGGFTGGFGGGFSDEATKTNIDSPGEAKYGIQVHNPGQPAVRTGGGMDAAPQPRAYSDQFAGIGAAYDNGSLGKTAQEQADAAEARRSNIQGIGQGISNAKNDHGAGLIATIAGMAGALSDEQAKTGIVDKARAVSDTAKAAAREYVMRGPTGLIGSGGRAHNADVARRAAERVSDWLQPEKMRTGVAEGSRGDVDYASGAAYLARAPQSRRVDIMNATRKPDGSVDMGRGQNEYAAKLAAWEQAGRDADEDRKRWHRAQQGLAKADASEARLAAERDAYRSAMAPNPDSGVQVQSDRATKMDIDSPGEAKRDIEVRSLGAPDAGEDFNRGAGARMGEDQDKMIEEALLRAGLARVEQEATVDGGLRAGKTNVARFADAPRDTGGAGGRHGLGAFDRGTERLERDFAQLPDKEWQYKRDLGGQDFAARANARMGLPPTARFGDARKSSPMAQDFERVPATRGVVAIDPETGLRKLDGGQLAATTAAATGAVARHALSLEERVRQLEGGGRPNPAQDSGAGVTDDEWEEVRRGLRGR